MSSYYLKRKIKVFHTALPHSHLVRGRLPLLRALQSLPGQRSLRLAAGNSGYCCSAVVADSPCHTASGCREQLSRVVGGCYEPVPFDPSEVPEEDGPERLRGKHAKKVVYFLIVIAALLYLIIVWMQCTECSSATLRWKSTSVAGETLLAFSSEPSADSWAAASDREGRGFIGSTLWADTSSVTAVYFRFGSRLFTGHTGGQKEKTSRRYVIGSHGRLFSTCLQLCIQFSVLSPYGRPVQRCQSEMLRLNVYMSRLSCSHLFKPTTQGLCYTRAKSKFLISVFYK